MNVFGNKSILANILQTAVKVLRYRANYIIYPPLAVCTGSPLTLDLQYFPL